MKTQEKELLAQSLFSPATVLHRKFEFAKSALTAFRFSFGDGITVNEISDMVNEISDMAWSLAEEMEKNYAAEFESLTDK